MESKTNSAKTRKRIALSPEVMSSQEDYWYSCHAITQHWQSDVKFFEDELSFFRLLIDKNLAPLIESSNMELTRAMVSNVSDLEKERILLAEQISSHLKHIAALAENPFVPTSQEFKDEHAKAENAFSDFTKKFRSIKAETFKLNEKVARSERARRLIGLT